MRLLWWSEQKLYFVQILDYLVHAKLRFDSVKVIFSIRGHSFGKDMALINIKATAELLIDWVEVHNNVCLI